MGLVSFHNQHSPDIFYHLEHLVRFLLFLCGQSTLNRTHARRAASRTMEAYPTSDGLSVYRTVLRAVIESSALSWLSVLVYAISTSRDFATSASQDDSSLSGVTLTILPVVFVCLSSASLSLRRLCCISPGHLADIACRAHRPIPNPGIESANGVQAYWYRVCRRLGGGCAHGCDDQSWRAGR
jgi:hypothetical protein